jgi:hypothetical protein
MIPISIEAWAHSFQLIAIERADSVGILATDAAAVIGLAAIAAGRHWPQHWWWSLPVFVVSAITCAGVPLLPKWAVRIMPSFLRPSAYSLPNFTEMYEQALARLQDEAAAATDTAGRIQGLAAKDFAAAWGRRGFNTVALGMLGIGAIFTVLLFLHDFR